MRIKAFSWIGLFSLVLMAPAHAQQQSDKFAVFVTGGDEAAPVVQALIKKMKDSKPFDPVMREDPSKVVVLISCMARKQTEPFVCMYISHYNGATFKTLLGGGLYLGMSPSDLADNFLSAIAADIVERFNDTNKQNLKESLETCLLMTDSKCNVPDPLQKELGAKQITLGQYLMKKNQ
jgi:hypothetical protein